MAEGKRSRSDHLETSVHAAGQPAMTSFPPITGLRSNLVNRVFTVETCISRLCLADLQEAAEGFDASVAAILQLAWAHLLQTLTSKTDDITFACVLPKDQSTSDAEPFRQVTCIFDVQGSRRQNIRHAIRRTVEELEVISPQRGASSNVLEEHHDQQSHETLLDLEYLSTQAPPFQLSQGRTLCHAIRLEVCRSADVGLSLQVAGLKTLIDENAAQLLLAQYDCLIKAILEHPDDILPDIYIQSPPALLSIANPDTAEIPPFRSLQSQFEDTARSAPDHIALEFWNHNGSQQLQQDTRWTYAELDRKAATFVGELHRQFGSVHGQVIPICMDRCPDLYVAILGVLKAGGAWCPIDPSFPSQRRHELITRVGAKVLIIGLRSPRDAIPGVTTIDLSDAEWRSATPVKQVSVAPDDLAYLIWTSGTTGSPKGVPISHGAAVASMASLQRSIPTKTDHGSVRCLQFSQFTFDVFVQDLFYTWGVHGTLISADRATMLGSFSDLASRAGATHAHLTPAFAASISRDKCPTLEVVTMIGEKLTQSVADDWSTRCQLYNTYGPAEATVVATLRRVPHGDVVQSANIGIPMPSVSAFVLQDSRVVMKNAIGELALGGPQLATGYWNDRKRTEERFVWNDYLKRTLYMTGDMVRQLHDGTFEFLGRTDDLIKIQGIRIELSEIAFTLRSCHPDVEQVEVLFLGRPDRPSKVIVAFLAVPSLCDADTTGKAAMEVALKGLISGKALLPDYMIPKVILAVKVIPKTPSAKIDRNALSKIYAEVNLKSWESKMNSSGSGDHPMDKLDSHDNRIISTIAEITGTSRVSIGRRSALPSIGIDSITATRLAAKLNQEGIEVSVMKILECATVEDLLVCSSQQYEKTVPRGFDLLGFHKTYVEYLDPALVDRVEVVMPVLPLQEAMLSESFLDSQSYWSHKLFQLDPETDLRRLERAWNLVAQQTDALRMLFIPVADIPRLPKMDMTFVQVILKEPRVNWKTLSTTEDGFRADVRARSRGIAEYCQRKRFTLPLWAVTIFSLESRNIMMFSMHHAIRDEPSLEMVMADLRVVYIDDSANSLPQRHQLRTAISFLYSTDDGRDQSNQEFWISRLADFQSSRSWPELKLADHGCSTGTTTYEWRGKSTYSDLRTNAVSNGTMSLAAVLRTVWGFLLCEYLETDRVVFGQTWSIRNDASALGDIIGPLLVVLPVPFLAQGTWRQMLQRETDFQKQSTTHYGVHPIQLRKILQRSNGESLYPAVFNFVPASTGHQDLESLWQEIPDIVELSVEHSIAFNVFVLNDDTLAYELTALKNLVDPTHLHVLAQQIDALLYYMLGNPDSCPKDALHQMPPGLLSLTPVDESTSANSAWNQTPTEWIDRYASVHPDWIAAEIVSSLDEYNMTCEHWSYRELQRSYRNAAMLIRRFRCMRRTIAVCLGRCLELYAIVLAIMNTGNVYLPIADDLPLERRTFLIQDSDTALLFTTKTFGSDLSCTCPTLYVDEIDFSKHVENHIESCEVQPTDNAYLLYTSGSTGSPKGVLVSRGNLMSFIETISHFIGSHIDMSLLQGKGKWLGMASYAFDVHLLEMFFPWRHGMATATASRSMLLDNLELALQRLQITHASFVPSLVDNAGLDPANLPELRYMSLGGEKISKKAIDMWSRSHVVLANAYGPTEATIGCCFRRVEPFTNVRNIGHPLSYTTVHVLQPDTTDYALRGTSGELCLTGDLVATGYHNRPDAKGFDDGFQSRKMYRTGDRVRMMADGSLEFLCRDDDQTKIRGQRIELAEVSEVVRSAFKQVLGILTAEVISLVHQHPALPRPQLIAFVVINGVTAETVEIISFPGYVKIEDIRAHCRNVLPSFMVPDHFIRLTSQPLVSTSRKVDIKQLRLIFDRVSLDDLVSLDRLVPDYSTALSDAESVVRNKVADVLAVEEENLKAESNLFQFGLDSLNVIALTIKLSKVGYDSSISAILKNPTIKAIAAFPLQKKREHPRTGVSNLEARFRANPNDCFDQENVASVLPCLPLQETLVATSVDNESETLYINHVYLELSPKLDHERLIQAWISTAKDHQILKTCFREFENGWIQVALKDAFLSVEHVSSDSIALDLQRRVPDIARDIIKNIEVIPPIRLTLAAQQLSGQPGTLLVSIHHALYDLDSFTMILDEVYASYEAAAGARVAHTPIEALINHIESQSPEDAKSFWTAYLADYEPSSPVDLVSNNSTRRSTSRELGVPLSNLETLAASSNTTPASLMQVLFGIALAEVNMVDDLVFGAVLSGRTISVENAHSILAPCITTIPQRVQIPAGSNLRDIIKSAQKGFVESIEYQHTALRSIHRWVKAKSPLFDALFTYTPKRGERSWSKHWHIAESSMQTEFALAMEVVADRLTNRITCHCEGTSESTQALFDRIEGLLKSLAQGADITVGGNPGSASQSHVSSNSNGAQWTKIEAHLKDVVAEICNVAPENIAADTSFFALGIDSITAIQLVRRLRHRSIQCSSADIMRYSCISRLAQHIGIGRDVDISIENGKAMVEPEQDLGQEGSETFYPCTPLQASMLTRTLGSDTSIYVHHHAIRLGPLHDRSKLRKAWKDLVAGTEILRTGFKFSRETMIWSGIVYKQSYIVWNEHDASISADELIAIIKKTFVFHREAEFARPPWRVDSAGNMFILSLHHSLYDEDSIRALFHDFWTIFTGSRLPQRPPFSVAARMIHQSGQEAEDFWARNLAGFGGSSVAVPMGKFQESTVRLDVDLNAVLEVCRSFGVTLQSVALLAFGRTLAVQSKRQDVVFGHVIRGRTLSMSGVDDVIGPLFNTVPMRIQLGAKAMSNKDTLRAIQDMTGESQVHQHASLSRIQAAWHKSTGNSDAELFDTIFVFQKRALSNDESSWDFIDVDDSVVPTEYGTNFECEQTDTCINVCVNSRTIEDLKDFVQTFEKMLHDILHRPNELVMSGLEDAVILNGSVTTKDEPEPDTKVEIDGKTLVVVRRLLADASGIPDDHITEDASIFSLGLDSISAIQIAATAHKQGLNLSVADVLQGRTVRGICQRFDQRKSRAEQREVLNDQSSRDTLSGEIRSKALAMAGIRDDDVEDVLPCLPGQHYHLLAWLKSGRTLGEGTFTYCSKAILDLEQLQRTWYQLRQRHAILRTVFASTSATEALQIILKPAAIRSDAIHLIEFTADQTISHVVKQIASHRFDLFSPPAELSLVRGHEKKKQYMILKLHHALYDARTIDVLINDLTALYTRSHLPPITQASSLIRNLLLPQPSTEQRTYWQQALHGFQPTLLYSNPRTPTSNTTSAPPFFFTTTKIPNLHFLETTCRNNHTSLPTIILIAFARTLAHQGGHQLVLGLLLGAGLHIAARGFLQHVDADLHQVAHDAVHVAADIADLGELRGLDLEEGRVGQPGEPARDLGLAAAGRPDHQDVLGQHLVAHGAGELQAAPAVAQRDGDGALGVVLADDVAIEFGNDLAG
ncbi:MAG: hypothetical protein LQ352_004298 [Teloschistes flavicans]|nr:MAG: hypothetical protein LQ352_004298 [Teloschistes flavicans]